GRPAPALPTPGVSPGRAALAVATSWGGAALAGGATSGGDSTLVRGAPPFGARARESRLGGTARHGDGRASVMPACRP
ncbi:MAG: hypothetical protein ACHQE6_10305, partial [Solirubrobacterales bacterium]